MDGVKVLMAVEVVASDVAEASRVVVLVAVASVAAAASAAEEASAAADLCRIVKTFIVYKRGRVNLTHPFFRIHPRGLPASADSSLFTLDFV